MKMKQLLVIGLVLMMGVTSMLSKSRAATVNPYTSLSFKEAYAKFRDKLNKQEEIHFKPGGDVKEDSMYYLADSEPTKHTVKIQRTELITTNDGKSNSTGDYYIPLDQIKTVSGPVEKESISNKYKIYALSLYVRDNEKKIKYYGTVTDEDDGYEDISSESNLTIYVTSTLDEAKDFQFLIQQMIKQASVTKN